MEGPRQDIPISVLMSCFNGARWLEESILSVLSQTWAHFEFIIVDDGSTDESRSIIQRFASEDSRIVPLFKSHSGLADSLNQGASMARGRWLARLDADDLSEPQRLERQYRVAEQGRELAYLGAGAILIDEEGRVLGEYLYPREHSRLVKHLEVVKRFPPHSSAFIRMKVFREVGGYRTRIRRAQDWDLWLRISEIGGLASVTEPLVQIRQHGRQVSLEESGNRQRIDSRVGIVSYWLRRLAGVDPVEADEAEFQAFRNWLAQRLVEEQLLDGEELVRQLRRCVRGDDFSASATAAFGLVWSSPSLIFHAVRDGIWGSSLPRRLAMEWIQQNETHSTARRGRAPR